MRLVVRGSTHTRLERTHPVQTDAAHAQARFLHRLTHPFNGQTHHGIVSVRQYDGYEAIEEVAISTRKCERDSLTCSQLAHQSTSQVGIDESLVAMALSRLTAMTGGAGQNSCVCLRHFVFVFGTSCLRSALRVCIRHFAFVSGTSRLRSALRVRVRHFVFVVFVLMFGSCF
jgi:hypothetical protein